MGGIEQVGSTNQPMVQWPVEEPVNPLSSSLPEPQFQGSTGAGLRMPVDPQVLDNPTAAEAEAAQVVDEWNDLAESVGSVLATSRATGVNIDKVLMEIAKISQADQREGFLLSKTSIDFNRKMRERIYEQVQKLNEEIAKLEQEIQDLQQEIENHNFGQKIGEGLASGFGGGKKKKLQMMSGELKQQQGKLDETRASLKEREKFLEHSYQVMQEAVSNLKDAVTRIKKSINQIQAVWQAAATTLDKT